MKKEYFCSVDGCMRSKRPANKSKGRSFGAREDKMREHVKTVHGRAKKRRVCDLESDVKEEEEEGGSSGFDDADQKGVKKVRSGGVFDGEAAWAGQGGY